MYESLYLRVKIVYKMFLFKSLYKSSCGGVILVYCVIKTGKPAMLWPGTKVGVTIDAHGILTIMIVSLSLKPLSRYYQVFSTMILKHGKNEF